MNVILKRTLVAVTLLLLALPIVAAGATTPADSSQKASIDKELALKHADFEHFAKSKVQQLNRNQKFSPSRMEIIKQADGTYRARYHQIDDSNLSVKVRRSQSSSIPYVGILSYREQVFESSAGTPDQFDSSSFAVVKVIPNRHIFSYQKNAWK